jgi:hypothetical protein
MSVIYNLKDSDRYVYHYTKPEKAIEYILKDRTLLLNSFLATNDPKESKNWQLMPWSTNPSPPAAFVDEAIPKEISYALKRTVHLTCFCTDAIGLSGVHLDDILLRGLARPRMWAQYAQDHKGFCLVFDKEKLLSRMRQQFSKNSFLSGPVSYKNRSFVQSLEPNAFRLEFDRLQEIGTEAYVREHMLTYFKELYFEKLEDWRDEMEWRVLMLDHDGGNPPLVDIEGSLVSVIHGANTSTDDSELAVSLTSDLGITHTRLYWNNHSPWYDLGNVPWSHA